MIRISKLADYSVVVLAALAAQENGNALMSTSALAQATKLPEPTVSKVLKLLSKAHIVQSTRGINGGYALGGKPEEITVQTIVQAIDGPISITACSDGETPDCSLVECCSVRGRWNDVNDAIRSALNDVTLADMMDKKQGKAA